jgi:hypothetical protein
MKEKLIKVVLSGKLVIGLMFFALDYFVRRFSHLEHYKLEINRIVHSLWDIGLWTLSANFMIIHLFSFHRIYLRRRKYTALLDRIMVKGFKLKIIFWETLFFFDSVAKSFSFLHPCVSQIIEHALNIESASEISKCSYLIDEECRSTWFQNGRIA